MEAADLCTLALTLQEHTETKSNEKTFILEHSIIIREITMIKVWSTQKYPYPKQIFIDPNSLFSVMLESTQVHCM